MKGLSTNMRTNQQLLRQEPYPKILIVDDDVDVMDAMCPLLEGEGAEVLGASSGTDALAIAQQHDLALIVTDVCMPGMSGFEFAEHLTSLHKNTPIIFITAICTTDRERLVGYVHGAVDYLEKPVNPRILLYKVRIFLDLYMQKRQLQIALDQLETKHLELQREVVAHKQAEQALRRAQKMEAIGILTGGIAHDFNNLLAVIMGNLEIIQLDLGCDIQKRVQTALKATKRGANLIRKLLSFSQKNDSDTEIVSIGSLYDGLHNLLDGAVTPLISVKMLTDDNLWPVKINPGDFEDSILNLIVNACAAMPDGGNIVISATNHVTDTDSVTAIRKNSVGDQIHIAVVDQGHGMPREVIERAFEPFFSTKEKGRGTGLGLSMVYGFVERSSGHIEIESVVGEGTTVHIFLPRSKEPDCKTLHEKNSMLNAVISPPEKRNILVVEDEKGLLNLAVYYLKQLGYAVYQANCGDEAVTILRKHKDIDLLFTDLIMPGGINGKMLAEQARMLNPDIKVILTSGLNNANYGDDNPALFDGFLKKPYELKVLEQQLNIVLRTGP